jgi:rhamnose transport system ATP-binding protein
VESLTEQPIAVELEGVEKSYPGVRAVRGVSLQIREGEVHGLVGENGAGKSTLVRMLSGAVLPDAGTIRVRGHTLPPGSPRAARRAGVCAIYQEPTIVPKLSPVANVFLGEARSRFGLIRTRWMRHRFGELCAQLGAKLPAGGATGELSLSSQRSIEILRALQQRARVVIMDEPTASMPLDERQALYGAIEALKRGGASVIFISHDLDEVLQVSDVVGVLRDGQRVLSTPAKQTDPSKLIEAMLGRRLEVLSRRTQRDRSPDSLGPEILRIDGLSVPPKLHDVHLTVRAGEIVGVAGLVGSGRTTLLRAIAGAEPRAMGRLLAGGQDVRWPASPRRAHRLGTFLVPEDRHHQGLVLSLGAGENVVLPCLPAVSRRGVTLKRRVLQTARGAGERVGFPVARLRAPAWTFSGGNQHKLMLAKALASEPRVLLLDEPLRGIDVGAKAEILTVLTDLAARGMGLVVVSEELEEILPIVNRLIVLADHRVAADLDGEDLVLQRVLRHMLPAR